ncbi:MAG: hypothetical protein GX962_13795 [Epulopiscium sp.]|nr:hypothetical protein [Candidatus Epulonipiscium sp.]
MNEQVRELLITAKDYLQRLQAGVSNIVDFLRQGEEGKALEQIPLIIEGLKWLCEALDGTKNYHSIDIVQLNSALEEINVALENTDYILLGDVLEYELLPVLEEWFSIL